MKLINILNTIIFFILWNQLFPQLLYLLIIHFKLFLILSDAKKVKHLIKLDRNFLSCLISNLSSLSFYIPSQGFSFRCICMRISEYIENKFHRFRQKCVRKYTKKYVDANIRQTFFLH